MEISDEVFVFPASFGQERLWFLEQLRPEASLYASWQGLRFGGPLDVAVLQRAAEEVVGRHEALRTTMERVDGALTQVVAARLRVPVEEMDLTGGGLAEAERVALDEAGRAFDLRAGPLVRLVLLRLAADDHVLLLGTHHTVSDGWSFGILWRELGAAYSELGEGRGPAAGAADEGHDAVDASDPALGDLPLQYADYAVWQREWLAGPKLSEQLAYWRERLAGAPALLALPTDHPRPPVQTFDGASRAFDVPAETVDALRALARDRQATLFIVLLAAYQALLSRYTGDTDIVVGAPLAGRDRTEFEEVVGFFVTTLALRTDLSGDPSFAELVDRVREGALGAYAHADVPFEQVVEHLAVERALSHTPLFQTMLVLQGAPPVHETLGRHPEGGVCFGDLDVQAFAVPTASAPFDLTLELAEQRDGLAGVLEYRTALFTDATADRISGHLQALLASVAADPRRRLSELDLLTPGERRQVLVDWNDTARPRPPVGVGELIATAASRAPAHPAVEHGDHLWTYAELDARANQLAHHLRQFGTERGQFVAVAAERGPGFVVALLAVARAGAAFLPLDPTHPPARLAAILDDAGARLVVTDVATSAALPPGPVVLVTLDRDQDAIDSHPVTAPHSSLSPNDLAYVIYTSGSTGRPKGVLIEHGGFAEQMQTMAEAWHVDTGSRVLQFAPPAFDAAVFEIFSTLVAGATLVTAPRDALLPGRGLLGLLRERAVSTVTLPPSILAALPHGDLPDLRTLAVAGEACPADLVARWAPGRTFVNGYGPTETTVCATVAYCEPDGGAPPIGRPIANVRTYVLDRRLRPLPIGVPGELCVGGVGLARGYHRQPDLTAERFVDHPSLGRLYRTGDQARWRPDGQLAYLGRLDEQVKVRGVRVEPAEVETVLRRHPRVDQAVVVGHGDAGERILVAYVTAAGPAPDASTASSPSSAAPAAGPDPAELRELARGALPESLVPATFVVTDRIPLTPNGKVDRAALPAPDLTSPRSRRVPPRTPAEEVVAALWAETLQTEAVGADEAFFDLGGNSLRLVDLHERLDRRFPGALSIVELFEHTTVAQQAAVIDRRETSAARPGEVAGFEL